MAMSEVKDENQRSKRIYCNQCKSETNHLLRGSHCRYDNGGFGSVEENNYNLWTCAGCDAGTLEVAYTASGMYNPDTDEMIYDYTYHPSRNSGDITPKIFRKLPRALVAIYREVVTAYNHGLQLLCAAGLRGLIEGICQEKRITGRNLQERIDGLGSILPENIVQHLHGFRFMGNDALHELAAPDRQTIRLAIEVAEDLLNFLYELDYKASRMNKKKEAR